jgi:hypothetical protein
MFSTLDNLTDYLRDRVSHEDWSLVGQLFNVLDGYFASISYDPTRCVVEREQRLPTAFGDKFHSRTELSERIFQLLGQYSRYEEHVSV